MRVVLIGASGMIGSRILKEAMRRAMPVRAVVRDPSKVPPMPGVEVCPGSAEDAASITGCFEGHDAVINAASPDPTRPSESMLAITQAVITACRNSGVRRLIVVGGAGSLTTPNGSRVLDSPDFPADWKPLAQAHIDALDLLRAAHDLDWTYFSPPALIEPGQRTKTYRTGGTELITDAAGTSRISAEDYAVALLDELKNPKHPKQQMTVGY